MGFSKKAGYYHLILTCVDLDIWKFHPNCSFLIFGPQFPFVFLSGQKKGDDICWLTISIFP